MCGRFARYSLSRDLERYFNTHPSSFEIQPNYNVAPTQEIPVIVLQEDERHNKLPRHKQRGIRIKATAGLHAAYGTCFPVS
jgi:putative SOS response-associated peptidase YedK